jgi:hypothetical protein
MQVHMCSTVWQAMRVFISCIVMWRLIEPQETTIIATI